MQNMLMLLVYVLCCVAGLVLSNMFLLRLLRQIPFGEDFLHGGQGYMEYIPYWRHMGKTAIVGAVAGLIAYFLFS